MKYRVSRGNNLAYDFASTANIAIGTLNSELGIGVNSLKEAPISTEPFRDVATLWHDPRSAEVSVEAVNLEFVTVLEDGSTVPVDPPEISIVVY